MFSWSSTLTIVLQSVNTFLSGHDESMQCPCPMCYIHWKTVSIMFIDVWQLAVYTSEYQQPDWVDMRPHSPMRSSLLEERIQPWMHIQQLPVNTFEYPHTHNSLWTVVLFSNVDTIRQCHVTIPDDNLMQLSYVVMPKRLQLLEEHPHSMTHSGVYTLRMLQYTALFKTCWRICVINSMHSAYCTVDTGRWNTYVNIAPLCIIDQITSPMQIKKAPFERVKTTQWVRSTHTFVYTLSREQKERTSTRGHALCSTKPNLRNPAVLAHVFRLTPSEGIPQSEIQCTFACYSRVLHQHDTVTCILYVLQQSVYTIRKPQCVCTFFILTNLARWTQTEKERQQW